jgi:REP element-mobilizing transposase RayT
MAGGAKTAPLNPYHGMARTARAEVEGTIYHVTQRGNGGRVIFNGDYERRFFLEQMRITAERYAWRCLAYCLMTNHFHLVIETQAPTLGDGMRRLGSVHAQTFNRRQPTYGHVYQERYGSVVVRTDAQFAQLLRYVALNPVAARLCSDPADWRWSSHRSMLASDGGSAIARTRVEELLEVWGGSPRARYARLFETIEPQLTADTTAGLDRPPLEALLALAPRGDALRAALDYGYTQAEVAPVLGVSQPTVSRLLRDARARDE